MRTAIIACVDASPVLDFGEQVLDQVPLFVDRFIVVVSDLAVGFWRDAGRDAARGQSRSEPVAVIAFIAQQFLSAWQGIKQQNSTLMVAHLSFGEHHYDGPPFTVADCM